MLVEQCENNDINEQDFELIYEFQPFDALPQEITKKVKKRGYNNVNRQRRSKKKHPIFM